MASLNLSSASNCPRCGVRLRERTKFCPNCAFRLRPDLAHPPPPAHPRTPLGQRLLSLGGYLAFASLLLLLAFAGVRLFLEPALPGGAFDQETTVILQRDSGAIPLVREDFLRIDGGKSAVGYCETEAPESRLGGFTPEPFGAVWIEEDFLISRREITNDQYYLFLEERARRLGETPDAERLIPLGWDRRTDSRALPRIYPRTTADRPVTGIPYRAALEYCAWLWETLFEADPEWIVDLPTSREYLRAGRRDSANNWPWGMRFEPNRVNLSGSDLLDVDDERVGEFDGVFGLLGNAAEWIAYAGGNGLVTCAAGGSFLLNVYNPDLWFHYTQNTTPFVRDGLEELSPLDWRRDIGFRPVARRAKLLPEFAEVKAGRVRFRAPESALLRAEPPRTPVALPFEEAEVARDFEISRTEVTRRQYLAFLASLPEAERERMLPAVGWRQNLLERAVFRGPAGDVPWLPNPGCENEPVVGIELEQARAYARWLATRRGDPRRECALPTLAQYVRAARGGDLRAYPWGEDRLDIELVCDARGDSEGRTMSLLGRLGAGARDVVGLSGNAMEWVLARPDRPLLAGGCYALPAEHCTIDSLVDPDWDAAAAAVDLDTAVAADRILGRWLRRFGPGDPRLADLLLRDLPRAFPPPIRVLDRCLRRFESSGSRVYERIELVDYAGFRVVLAPW